MSIDPREFVFNGFTENGTYGNDRSGYSSRYQSKLLIDEQNKNLRESSKSFKNNIMAANAM